MFVVFFLERGCHQVIQSGQLFEEEREDFIYRGGASIRETGLTLLRTSQRLALLDYLMLLFFIGVR